MTEGQTLKLKRRSLAKESQESRRQRHQRRRARESKEGRHPPIYQQLRGLREPQSVLESTNGSILERAEDLAADFRGGVTYVGPKSLWIGVFHGYLMPAGYLIQVSAADPWKVPSRWMLRVVGPCHFSTGPPACEEGELVPFIPSVPWVVPVFQQVRPPARRREVKRFVCFRWSFDTVLIRLILFPSTAFRISLKSL